MQRLFHLDVPEAFYALPDDAIERDAGLRMQFFCIDGAVAVLIGSFEQ